MKQVFLLHGDWGLGIGDWGLGIGDWAQSPIPNPQSPIPNPQSPSNSLNGILIIIFKNKNYIKIKLIIQNKILFIYFFFPALVSAAFLSTLFTPLALSSFFASLGFASSCSSSLFSGSFGALSSTPILSNRIFAYSGL